MENIIVVCPHCGAKNRVPENRIKEHPVCGRCRQPLRIDPGMIHPMNVTDSSFGREVMQYPGVVLVMFWSPRCPYCRQLAPVIDRLAPEFAGRARIAKFDVDQNRIVPSQFTVSGVPTTMIVKHGKVLHRLTGVVSKEELIREVEAAISH